MKKLSVSLKESRFVDLINKKFTDEVRKEDIIGNLQTLKPVDIGTSVLWADKDLCVDKKYLFTFDEVTNMLKGLKWRLPTPSEVRELKKCEKDHRDGKYIFTNNGKSLTFYPHGFINVSSTREEIQCSDDVKGWTDDLNKYTDCIRIYIMDPDRYIDVGRSRVEYKNSLLSARLVKDK